MSTPTPDNSPVPVLFRVWRAKPHNVFALFPSVAGSVGQPWTCESYEHLGQHCSADLTGCIQRSRPAKPSECRALRRELEGAPYHYRLTVRKRSTFADYEERKRQLGIS